MTQSLNRPGNRAVKPSPFHYGERLVQDKLGVRGIEQWARRVVRDHMPDQHRTFYEALPFLVVSARDTDGRPWATILEGEEGFVSSPQADRLVIDGRPAAGDALEHAFAPGADVGILGIELATRRRNRVNGRVAADARRGISFAVDQSFGNCPQYIRERQYWRVDARPSPSSARGTGLTELQRDWIARADTFFIASGYRGEGESPTFGMDVSHRGGDRGLVDVVDARHLRFPDYSGNNHYNTIGNLVLDDRAGFLFVDFETGSLLQVSGRATIDWSSPEVSRFPGARRLVCLEIDAVVEVSSALGLRWHADAEAVQSLRLVEKTRESDEAVSFVFEARDGGPLAPFKPGQHLPIELDVPGFPEPVRRTYSLSSSPRDPRYRITVKREPNGVASSFLHDRLREGAILTSRRPAGGFDMTCAECPLVLVSAGIGITPMLAILHAVAAEGSDRPVWFIHGARDGAHHAFKDEVSGLVRDRPNVTVDVSYSRPGFQDAPGIDYDREGRVTGERIAKLVDAPNAHYFLCGPNAFMADIKEDLERRGISEDRIHHESFGPTA